MSRVSISTLGEGKFIKIVMGIFTDSPAFAKETIKQHLEGTILGADCLQLREIKEKKNHNETSEMR